MTDYWKSTPKYYCKYCNCWLTDSKSAIARHENGRTHKEKMALYFKNQKEKKESEEKNKRQMANAIRAIEQAAQAAYSKDVATLSAQSGATIHISDQDREHFRLAALQPPPAPNQAGNKVKFSQRPSAPSNKSTKSSSLRKHDHDTKTHHPKLPSVQKFTDDPFLGQSLEDGIVYIAAEHVQGRIERGLRCEVWSEAMKTWRPAQITGMATVPILNTQRALKQFAVKFDGLGMPPSAVVRASALRLIPPPPPPVEEKQAQRDAEKEVRLQKDQVKHDSDQQNVVDQNTGYTKWQTVSLTIAETQHQQAQRDASNAKILGSSRAGQRKKNNARLKGQGFEEAEGTMDAYAEYNPHGGAYRGVNVDETTATLGDMRDNSTDHMEKRILETPQPSDSSVSLVKFRKKNRKKGKAKRMRRMRTNDDDG